ncbi:MAG: hypothetical protein VX622_03065, partial [Pseudomonadota bacterium]|nr:hypothetical protein [Pseudomonadota bacterium]
HSIQLSGPRPETVQTFQKLRKASQLARVSPRSQGTLCLGNTALRAAFVVWRNRRLLWGLGHGLVSLRLTREPIKAGINPATDDTPQNHTNNHIDQAICFHDLPLGVFFPLCLTDNCAQNWQKRRNFLALVFEHLGLAF